MAECKLAASELVWRTPIEPEQISSKVTIYVAEVGDHTPGSRFRAWLARGDHEGVTYRRAYACIPADHPWAPRIRNFLDYHPAFAPADVHGGITWNGLPCIPESCYKDLLGDDGIDFCGWDYLHFASGEDMRRGISDGIRVDSELQLRDAVRFLETAKLLYAARSEEHTAATRDADSRNDTEGDSCIDVATPGECEKSARNTGE